MYLFWTVYYMLTRPSYQILNKYNASSLIFEWAKEELHPEGVVHNFEHSNSKKVMDYLKVRN